jgi:hypothetical protein
MVSVASAIGFLGFRNFNVHHDIGKLDIVISSQVSLDLFNFRNPWKLKCLKSSPHTNASFILPTMTTDSFNLTNYLTASLFVQQVVSAVSTQLIGIATGKLPSSF